MRKTRHDMAPKRRKNWKIGRDCKINRKTWRNANKNTRYAGIVQVELIRVSLKIFQQPQRVVNRGVGVARRYGVSDAKQLKTSRGL